MRKKLLSIVLTLCMVVTMIPLFAGVAFAGEAPSFTYTGPDGKSVVTISNDDPLFQSAEEVTFTPIKKNGKPNPDGAVTAKFVKLSDLLTEKGATLPACSYSIPAGSGTSAYVFGYQPDTDVCVYYDSVAQTFNTAVNGGYGFLWAKGFTSITGKNHEYGEQHTCTNSITYFNPDLEGGAGGKDEKPCGAVAPKEKLPAATLAAIDFTWDGKVKQPAVTVKDGSKTLKEGTDYAVSYAGGRKNIGTYAVTVTGKGHYEGTQTVSFKINPKGTSLKKVKAARKSLTVKWKKQAKKMPSSVIGGYQVQCSQKKDFSSGNKTVKVKGMKKTTRKISKLTSKKTYYVRVRTYKKVGKTTYYSAWSKVKKAKVK